MTSAQGQWWRRLHNWADVIHVDFQTVISRVQQNISIYPFYTGERKLRTAKFQVDPGMFSYQNRRGLNRLILRPLWLMTSAAADVISVPSVVVPVLCEMFHVAMLFPERHIQFMMAILCCFPLICVIWSNTLTLLCVNMRSTKSTIRRESLMIVYQWINLRPDSTNIP